MNMAKEPRLAAERFDITNYFEASCEYSMPEYYPAIRRVVSVSACPLPDSKFLSGEVLEHGGTVSFSMLYIGEDGSLTVLPCSCEYSEKVTLPKEIRGVGEVMIDVCTVDQSFRVTAPRRVSLRAKLRARIMSDEDISCAAVAYEGEKSADIQAARTVKMLRRKVPTLSRCSCSQTGNVTGEVSVGAGTKILSCPGVVSVSEVRAKMGAVTVRGDIVLRCLAFTDRGVYAPVKLKMPFEENVTCEAAREGDSAYAFGRVASVSVTEDVEGSGEFSAEAEFDLTVSCSRAEETVILDDAYSTSFDMTQTRRDIASLSPLCALTSSLTLSGVGKRKNRPEDGEYLIDCELFPVIEKAEARDGRVIFMGKADAKAYIAGDGEVTLEEFSLPIKFEVSVSDMGEGELMWRSHAAATDSSARLEGDTIAASGEICLALEAYRKNVLSPVVEMQLQRSGTPSQAEPHLRVIYPEGGETLWSIAKRCACDIDSTERVNAIAREEIVNSPIIIPMK